MRGSKRVTDQDPEGKYEVLQKYGRDLTIAARDGKLDPVTSHFPLLLPVDDCLASFDLALQAL